MAGVADAGAANELIAAESVDGAAAGAGTLPKAGREALEAADVFAGAAAEANGFTFSAAGAPKEVVATRGRGKEGLSVGTGSGDRRESRSRSIQAPAPVPILALVVLDPNPAALVSAHLDPVDATHFHCLAAAHLQVLCWRCWELTGASCLGHCRWWDPWWSRRQAWKWLQRPHRLWL